MDLNPKTVEIIKATYPLIKTHGLKVTERMYDILFDKYPECRSLFVTASSQPEKLANAILAFVSHIERINEFADSLKSIAQKHVSSEVKAIHYPMVADALIAAMRVEIGPAIFTQTVADAWVDAYMFLASHLMTLEGELYAASYKQKAIV